jgi:hypothetical protein
MTEINEYLEFRKDLLKDASDENGFIQESEVLARVTPSMLDAKLVDTEDPNDAFHDSISDGSKLNAYSISESGERLQLYVIDERTLVNGTDEESLLISLRTHYEKQFRRVTSLVKNIISGTLKGQLQDSSPILPLLSKLTSVGGVDQFDVIDVFLISLTATVERPGGVLRPRSIHFKENTITATISEDGEKRKKDFLVMQKLIDLNFLFNVEVAKGNREPLVVDFEKTFGKGIPAIQAANEKKFESYLCVLPATILADLYKRYSTRLLEKNVRSFLQFRGVNAGLKKTIREEPEKFIAYNNGLTITATSGKIKNRHGQVQILSLDNFQVVNGGQTTASIYFSKKEGFDISKVSVMAKINIAKQTKERELDELIAKISEFSNAQSRVSKVDLRSRNPQLLALKKLSQSVATPTGDEWFFERAKGEYQTEVRMKGRNKKILTKKFPTKRRFTKELLAKYYSAWGETPHLVKKGGEKIFRYFIEEVSEEIEGRDPVVVDRDFYENIISRIILFRNMEDLHGTRSRALGQLRSVVIPYAISVLYIYTNGNDKAGYFDFSRIWSRQGLEDDLSLFLEELMKLMYKLIKKYSASDDYGEYSKRKELWDSVGTSPEIIKFMSSTLSSKILKKYTVSHPA